MEVAGKIGTVERLGAWFRGWWPLKAADLGKFLPLFLMKLFISFNYTILHSTKDTVVVTSPGGGAEVIPVLKGGVVIVIAFLIMLLYAKLSNLLSSNKLFYAVITPFLVFFLLYGIVLYPYREFLSPQSSADWLMGLVGESHKHWIVIYRYWMNSLFFVFAELWGGLIIGVLFWGFANQINSISDAARFYALYTAGGHLGTMIAGGLVYLYSNVMQQQNYNTTVFTLMSIVVAAGLVIIGLYWYVTNNPKIVVQQVAVCKEEEESNTKLGLKDSLLYVVRSPYLGLIALMVVGYGLAVNLVEVPWKSLLALAYPQQNDYQAYMGVLQFSIGVVSLLVSLFLGSSLLKKYGWFVVASITPAALGITSLLFFGLYFVFPDFATSNVKIFSFSPLMLLVACGTVHNVVCKAMKYCFFDPTKEMAYIPLDKEAKVKGKAAVDLVGARFGKSGSSWLQLALIDLVGGGSILSVVPLLAPCVIIMVACWMFAVYHLNKRFNGLYSKSDKAQKSSDINLTILASSS